MRSGLNPVPTPESHMPIQPEFRHEAIQSRLQSIDSEALTALREDASVWSAVVLWDPYPDQVSDEWLRMECQRIRETGFQAVRFHHFMPTYLGQGSWDTRTADRWISAAEEAGLLVIVVGEVFDDPPEQLLGEHGVTREDYQRSWLEAPESQGVLNAYVEGTIGSLKGRVGVWCVLGEPNSTGFDADSGEERSQFTTWLQAQYGDLEGLSAAWRSYPTQPDIQSWEDAVSLANPDGAVGITGVENARKLYGAIRDRQAFLADRTCSRAEAITAAVSAADPGIPVGVGSHQLFINQPKLAWDIGRWARAGSLHTTSIHLSWHFEAVAGEVDLPVYLQARITRDMAKSGFTSAFETTGGPVQFSGGYGNHMDEGLMRRLCLSYLAAGNQTMAFWTWNSRPGGWEQGEYGMLGLSGEIMPWAHEAGRIAAKMMEYRHELWAEDHVASVGIVESWDTDAILMREPHRHGSQDGIPGNHHGGTPSLHRLALIGAGRALTQAGVDWEYVTTEELLQGLAGCYDTLLLPWHRSVDASLLDVLTDYVQAGGRVVVDCQFAFCDRHGRLHPQGPDTPQGQLFGAWTEAIHDGRTGGPVWEGAAVNGFWSDLGVCNAEVIATFEDGRPVVTRNSIGEGEAILIAMDPASEARTPGQKQAGTLLASLCPISSNPWSCTHALTLHRATEQADHFFLLNPGPATTAFLHMESMTTCEDVLAENPLPVLQGGCAIPIDAGSASWIRIPHTR